MKNSGIELYKKKLTELGLKNEHISHIAAYYDGNRDVSDFVKVSLPGRLLDFFTSKPERYDNYLHNEHHWTTGFCFNKVLPQIFECVLGCKFDDKMYEKIGFSYLNNDISFHNSKFGNKFEFTDLVTGFNKSGGIDSLRDLKNERNNGTYYHRLFVGSHSVSHIKNVTSDNGRKLLVNCDSMSIPIIPLIADHFDEILVLDNRTDLSFSKEIEDFKATHYIGLMLTQSYYDNKHIENLK